MKKRITTILTLLMLFFSITNVKVYAVDNKNNENRNIKVGTSGTYYPFTFLDENHVKGFEIDIWNEIGKRIGYNVEYETASFSGLFGMLDSSKVDVLANQITITDERKEKYYFSDPYVESGAQIVVEQGNKSSISSIGDLKGKKVGVDLGSNYEQILKDKDSGANIITYQSTDAAFNDLMIGRLDAVVIDKISALININEKKLPLELAGEPFEKVVNSFVFTKNDNNLNLIKEVNSVLSDMKDDGTLEDISNKWLNTNVIAKDNESFFAKLLKSVFNGAKVTILLSIIAMIIGLILGTVISVIRNLKVPVLSQIFSLYVSFFRGTPVLVQLFLLYFGLPEIFPILKGMGGFTAAYIALGFNASAYISEVLRGSFNAIDKGQMEACLAIGMNHIQAIKRIVLPQVLRISIPSIGNISIDIIKGSSLAFTIGVAEILAKAQMIASANYKFFESYILIAVIYWIIIEILTYIQKVLEKKLSIY